MSAGMQSIIDGIGAPKKKQAPGGITIPPPPRADLIAMRNAGMTAEQIGERCGVSRSTAYKWLAGITGDQALRREEPNLTRERILYIKAQKGKLKAAIVSKANNVHVSTVYAIWRGRLHDGVN